MLIYCQLNSIALVQYALSGQADAAAAADGLVKISE